MNVLGIESSCDETSVAIYDTSSAGIEGLRAHHIYSQTQIHAAYGGVVPELASRDHVRKLLPLVQQTITTAGMKLGQLDAVAYTAGPGLAGALRVGVSFASSLAWALDIPSIAVHHMEGHLLAPLLAHPTVSLPCVALLISGGHTQLVLVRAIGTYHILGQTLDDAAGEAFDKTATLLGLAYPGGPALAALALQGRADRMTFSHPMTDRKTLDFSFSGLKTQVAMAWQRSDQTPQTRADIAYAFEQALVATVVTKCLWALDATDCSTLLVSGGVGANKTLRNQLMSALQARNSNVFFPPMDLCTDNAAMIAFAGGKRLCAGQRSDLSLKVYPRWNLSTLPPIA